MLNGLGAELSMTTGAAVKSVETQALCAKGRGQYPCEYATEAASVTAGTGHSHEEPMGLLSVVLSRSNMMRAYERVMRNKGAAGVDGLTVGELKSYLKSHWLDHKAALLKGRYQPQPVRKVEIPKSGGGVRQLGIPTVLDRLIQQAQSYAEAGCRWAGRSHLGAVLFLRRLNRKQMSVVSLL